MIVDAAGDIDALTNGALQLYIDVLGVGPSGVIKEARYNCYLRVAKSGYMQLLFRVTTPSTGLWPAAVVAPEGDKAENIHVIPCTLGGLPSAA